jgi:hypothetical protein
MIRAILRQDRPDLRSAAIQVRGATALRATVATGPKRGVRGRVYQRAARPVPASRRKLEVGFSKI